MGAFDRDLVVVQAALLKHIDEQHKRGKRVVVLLNSGLHNSKCNPTSCVSGPLPAELATP